MMIMDTLILAIALSIIFHLTLEQTIAVIFAIFCTYSILIEILKEGAIR